MKDGRLFVAGALIAVLLVGCGGAGVTSVSNREQTAEAVKKKATAEVAKKKPAGLPEIKVGLDGYPGPENVGVLMAKWRGFFTAAGFHVWFAAPTWPRRPVTYVSKGMDDFAVTQEPQLILAREKGAPIVAVGSVISRPTAALIWLKKSKIENIADLKGKTIAIPGVPFQEDFLQSVLARAGLTLEDVHVRKVAYRVVPMLLNGRADAIFGGSWNLEGVLLRARGANPAIKRVQHLGIPDYEQFVVIARADRVAEDPKSIRRFMAAVARGTAAAIADPKAALKAIQGSFVTNSEADRQEVEAQLEATLPLLSRSGHMKPERARELVEWMHRQGMIQQKPPASELLTNRFLSSP